MNDLEKRSFYSFLGLYIISSLLFIALTAFWYYTAQKNALKSTTFYELEHVADSTSGAIVIAHMHDAPLEYPPVPDTISVALIDTQGKQVRGDLPIPVNPEKTGYFKKDGYNILVSNAPREHLNIRYVVVESRQLAMKLHELGRTVLIVMVMAALFIIVVAWILSRLFMRPVHQKITQTERFINDVTHELNTPISALTMATDQALKRGKCTDKTLRNISISTRQLYDIYRSLTYLNFDQKHETAHEIDWAKVLAKSVEYYRPMCESKRITLQCESETTMVTIPEVKTQLLFSNLIGNAIKYSPAGSTITITLKENCLRVKDQGIGIEPERKKEIFKRYERGTDYAGGFGVGLNIVKSICDEYGIEIKVESAPNKGAMFELCLPG
jgi:two-component system OmpR family sensor kinase